MTPEDMAAIMDSAYIIYQRRIQEAEASGRQPSARGLLSYHAIKYYCGLVDLDHLLSELERMMDLADPTDYSPDGAYGVISLLAFYCQYLRQYPELLPQRTGYLEALYRRTLAYVDAFPDPSGSPALFQYLRQLSHTFVETEHSVPYGQFLQGLLLRFAPEVYLHAQTVGEAARALCEIILEDEPDFFDDIPFLRAIQDPAQKRREVLAYAMDCGAFHDVGKLNVIELYSRIVRQWFEEEYEMAHLHTVAGETLLAARPSTSRYAAVALGHHAWYDGSRGYPAAYRRLDCPERQMVDVIGLVDWLESMTHTARVYAGMEQSFPQAVQSAIELGGKRFSPLLTARLRDRRTAERLQQALDDGRHTAYRRMYDNACRAEETHKTEAAT